MREQTTIATARVMMAEQSLLNFRKLDSNLHAFATSFIGMLFIVNAIVDRINKNNSL